MNVDWWNRESFQRLSPDVVQKFKKQQGKIELDELDGSISEVGGDQEKVVSKNWCMKYTKNDCAFVDCVIDNDFSDS